MFFAEPSCLQLSIPKLNGCSSIFEQNRFSCLQAYMHEMQQWLYIQSELCILKSGWICHIKYSTWEVQSGFLFSAFPWQKATTLSACKHDPLSKIISGVSGLKSGTFGWFLFPKFPRRVMAKSIPWDDSARGSWGKYHPWPYSTFVPIYSSALIPSFLPKLSITKLEIQTSTKSFLAVNFLAEFFFSSLHTEDMRAIKSTHSLTHRKLMCWSPPRINHRSRF